MSTKAFVISVSVVCVFVGVGVGVGVDVVDVFLARLFAPLPLLVPLCTRTLFTVQSPETRPKHVSPIA